MIPCIKNKCILYPVCMSKPVIDCSPLKQFYITNFDPEAQILHEANRLWDLIHKYLPSVSVINPEASTPILYEYLYFHSNCDKYKEHLKEVENK